MFSRSILNCLRQIRIKNPHCVTPRCGPKWLMLIVDDNAAIIIFASSQKKSFNIHTYNCGSIFWTNRTSCVVCLGNNNEVLTKIFSKKLPTSIYLNDKIAWAKRTTKSCQEHSISCDRIPSRRISFKAVFSLNSKYSCFYTVSNNSTGSVIGF